MSRFKYNAYDSHGAKLQGEIDALDLASAKKQLQSKAITLVDINPVNQRNNKPIFASLNNKITLQQLEFVTSELAILLKSGVRLDKGLSILRKGAASGELASMLTKLAESVKAGQNVADAFSQYPEVFDSLYINMIKLGEASGNLDEVFTNLSVNLKFKRLLQSKITQAVIYPTIILFVCISCVLFVFNYIVPQMSSIFDQATELPVYTQLLLATSDWFIHYQWYLLAGIIFTVFSFINALKNEQFKRFVGEYSLRLPLVGKAILLIERIRFNSSMAMMLTGGVSLVESLKLSAGNVKNIEIKTKLASVSSNIKQGGSLSQALQLTPLFTEFNISLVEVGEESGELIPVFNEIAERSRHDFESWTDTLTSMIEPILILVMGAIVGSVVVVMLLSIVSTNDIGM